MSTTVGTPTASEHPVMITWHHVTNMETYSPPEATLSKATQPHPSHELSSVPSHPGIPPIPTVTPSYPDSQAHILSELISPAGTKGESVYSEPALLAPGRSQ